MKKQPSHKRQTGQGKAHAAQLRRDAAGRRVFNNIAGFWRVCAQPVCRRNRSCSGDAHACFKRLWPLMPEEEKEYLRACITAAQTTRSAPAIHRAGIAARDEQLKRQAQITAPLAAPAMTNSAPATAAAPDVRVRRL